MSMDSRNELGSLSIFRATGEQLLEARRRDFHSWGPPLSLEDYMKRESHLDAFEHAEEGKHTAWVLAPRTDPETLDFKCACETYRREVVVRRANSSEMESAIGYGIASVYTPARLRGKGYAFRMMQLLHWVLAPRSSLPPFPESWGKPPLECFGDATVSVLFSDVGSQFYANAGPDEVSKGWIMRDPISTEFDVPTDMPTTDVSALELTERDCLEFWEKDSALIRNNFPRVTKQVGFSFLPENGLGRFMLQRNVAYEGMHGFKAPKVWGVALDEEARNFVTWHIDRPIPSPPRALLSVRLRATPETFHELLNCMMSTARQRGIQKVEFWNLPKELQDVATSLGGTTFVRDEHLSSFKWYGPEKTEDIEWFHGEKFAWC